jgi:hypothetical protein
MTTLNIGKNDMTAIKEIQKMVVQKFHFDVQIMDRKTTNHTKTKWAEFAEKMDGLFTPDIVKHIDTSRKEARDNFIANP